MTILVTPGRERWRATVLSGLDSLAIPKSSPGSVIHAKYTAGAQDTSVWMMYMDGKLDDVPGILKLVD